MGNWLLAIGNGSRAMGGGLYGTRHRQSVVGVSGTFGDIVL